MTAAALKDSTTSHQDALLTDQDVLKIRQDFPILATQVHGKPLIYFDNAATSLKPRSVAESVANHYLYETSNVHRGVHYLSERATSAFEEVREKVRDFINAEESSEIIFTRGTTESINLVALSLGQYFIRENDEIIISEMEHHSNIVPWQMVREKTGCVLKIIPVNDAGELILEEFEKLISPRTRLIAINYISNALGTVNPVKDIIRAARRCGARILLDGAQAAPHLKIDVRDLDCDFFAFSAHKMFGPTGVGVLYAKASLLEEMPPVFGGGDMIDTVTFEKTTYNVAPHKFEAGTPHIAGVIGFGAALDYMKNLGIHRIARREQELLEYATSQLGAFNGVRLIGTASKKSAVLSFVLNGVHPHDMGTLLDLEGVAIRTGHHCTQPLMRRFGVTATARASLAVYNTKEEIDVFFKALQKIKSLF